MRIATHQHCGAGTLDWILAAMLALGLGMASSVRAQTNGGVQLLNQGVVDSQGVFLDQIAPHNPDNPAPHLRLADAPAWGQALMLTRAQIQALVKPRDQDLANGAWTGAERVRVMRRSRILKEAELRDMLTAVLQKEYVRDRGELELKLSRPWAPVPVPDEALELKVLDVPVSGVSPSFVVRFELRAGTETAGNWQTVAQGKIWREILVAAAPLKRGQVLGVADAARERRDILSQRDLLTSLPGEDATLELTENVVAGAPIYMRSVRPRPIVHRGDLIEALIQDGPMSVSLRVEALEEGAAGQAIRVRNPQTRRELRGKVQNEQSILVSL